uniref:Uncharacterized protein n=1 Tax=Romanomermis culicivorax TaxID=13658 RepID=A0A915HS51_ROMCU
MPSKNDKITVFTLKLFKFCSCSFYFVQFIEQNFSSKQRGVCKLPKSKKDNNNNNDVKDGMIVKPKRKYKPRAQTKDVETVEKMKKVRRSKANDRERSRKIDMLRIKR